MIIETGEIFRVWAKRALPSRSAPPADAAAAGRATRIQIISVLSFTIPIQFMYILAAQQFSTGLGLRASCQHAAEKALGGGRSRDYRPPLFDPYSIYNLALLPRVVRVFKRYLSACLAAPRPLKSKKNLTPS
jgi:hypothetical protein